MASVSVSVAPGGPHQVTRGATAATVLPGWLRTASNTGLAAVGLTSGDLTAYTGSTSPSNTTITLKDISGGLSIGANVTLDRCRISTNFSGDAIAIAGNNFTMVNCDMVGSYTGGQSVAIKGSSGTGMSLTSVKITGYTIDMWLEIAGTVDQCYAYAHPSNYGAAHNDGFTRRSGTGALTITNSRFVCDTGSTTGASFIKPDYGDIQNVTLSTCWLAGNGNNATLESGVGGNNTGYITYDDNRFTPTEYGAVSKSGTGWGPLTWTNNYIYTDNGTDYRGTSVSAP